MPAEHLPIPLSLDAPPASSTDAGWKDAVIARYRRVLNQPVETAIITLDGQGRVTGWNGGARQIFGWAEAEMLGQSLGRVFAEEDGGEAALLQEIAQATAAGIGRGEGWRLRQDGGRFWATGETRPLSDQDPHAGFVKIVRDRTEQRAIEVELLERTQALEILNRTGTIMARETDLSAIVQAVTDAGVALTGAQFGAFFYNLVNAAGESYTLYTLSGVPREAFARFPMPRNTTVFAPTFSGEGIVRSDDITADPRYGRNAPHQGMPAGHLPVRSYLAVPVVSRSGEVLGGLFFGHPRPGVFTAKSETSLAGLAGEAAVAIDNMRLLEKTRQEVEERRRAEAALRELNAGLEEQVRRRTEEALQSAEALRQAQKMEAVGQLTGGIAHDFNNLLQVIVGNLDILNRTLPPEMASLRRSATQAMSGAKRAAAITQRLLAFSRRQPLDPRPLNVNLVVQGMSELLRRALGETIELQVALDADPWTTEADPNELESALLNLAVNARDAMPAGGRLSITTANVVLDAAYAARHPDARPGPYVRISMADTGSGMDAATMARVFEPFFTTKEVGKGTGLGLSQVYGFVQQSAGHVALQSEPGRGTEFHIHLPRREAGPAGTGEREAAQVAAAAGETILVVEDDAEVRAFTVAALRQLGYQVVEATDGPAAMDLLRGTVRVDLVFSDVVLPGGMAGTEVVAKARALRPGIRSLFTTGYARDAELHGGVLAKPFTVDELAAKLREALDA